MATVDDLKFQEFDDAANLLAANPDATTISIDEPAEIPKNQHGRLQEPGREEDDELLGTDDSDKTELLAGQKKSAPFWTFEYYQTFFDVDTYQVLDRIKGSVFPVPGKNFVRLYIRSNPDLYGRYEVPFGYVPHSSLPLLLVAISRISLSIWANQHTTMCPSSEKILWIIPQKVVRWVLMMFSLCLSGSVLVMTFWPAVRDDNRRIALATVGTIVLLHALLAVGCLAYFFDAPELDFPAPIIPAHNGTTVITKSQ
ncbi:protein YIPF1 isoform 3-T5 [Theristicus caerulescens]